MSSNQIVIYAGFAGDDVRGFRGVAIPEDPDALGDDDGYLACHHLHPTRHEATACIEMMLARAGARQEDVLDIDELERALSAVGFQVIEVSD